MYLITRFILIFSLLIPFSCINKENIPKSNITNKVIPNFNFYQVQNTEKITLEEPDIFINNIGNGFIFWKNKGRKISNFIISEYDISIEENSEKNFIYLNENGNGIILINGNIFENEKKEYRNISYQLIKSNELSGKPTFLDKKDVTNDSFYSILDIDDDGNGIIVDSIDEENLNYFDIKSFVVNNSIQKKKNEKNILYSYLSKKMNSDSKIRNIIKINQKNNGFITNNDGDINYVNIISKGILKEKNFLGISTTFKLVDDSDVFVNENGNGIIAFKIVNDNLFTLFAGGLSKFSKNRSMLFSIKRGENASLYKPRIYLNNNSEGILLWHEIEYNNPEKLNIYSMTIKNNSVLYEDNYNIFPAMHL
jgi:hypothetical protein